MKRWQKIVLGLVVLYAVLGAVVLPLVLESQLPKNLQKQLNAKVSLKSVSFNPFIFKLSIEDLHIKDLQNSKDIVSFRNLLANVDPFSLLWGEIDLYRFLLNEPYLYVQIDKNGKLNLAQLPKTTNKRQQRNPQKTKEQTSLPHLHIGSFAIENAKVVFEDYTRPTPYKTVFDPISFRVNDIDTKSKEKNDRIRIFAGLGIDGEFKLDSKILSYEPFKIQGRFSLAANQLYDQWRYVRDALNLEVADGKLSLEGDFRFDQNDTKDTLLSLDKIELKKLRIKPKNKLHDVFTLKRFAILQTDIRPFQNSVKIAKIDINGINASAKRDKQGAIDWQEYIKTSFAPSTKKENKKDSKPWSVSIKKIDLKDLHARFEDALVSPSVTSTLDRFDLSIDNFTLASDTPFGLKNSLTINAKTVCNSDMQIVQKPLNVLGSLACKEFDITHYNPYINYYAKRSLKKFDLKLQSAYLSFGSEFALNDRNGTIQSELHDANLSLDRFALLKKSTKEPLMKFHRFSVANAAFKMPQNEVLVATVALEGLHVDTKRYKNKKLNIDDLVVAKKGKTKKEKKQPAKPFHAIVKDIKLQNALVSFTDQVPQKSVKTVLDRINVEVKNFDTKQGSKFQVASNLRIDKSGKLKAKAKVRHTPLQVSALVDLQKLPLYRFSPYLEEISYLVLKEGTLDIKDKIAFEQKAKTNDLKIKGDLRLQNFALARSSDKQHVFQIADMKLNDYVVQLPQNRAYVNKVDIDGLFVDAFIDENKTINFAKFMKPQPKAKEPKKPTKKDPFMYQVAMVNIKNSNALFADYSLPIKFKTEIHELQGNIYAISSDPREISYVDLKGAVDKYGSMKLQGNIQSSKPKEYTDIAMNFRNLDMKALSGYTAQFAGYKIAKGKLFVDLKYKIEHSNMLGSNALMIKNVELGEEIEDENITHLPLGLAIALLEDSDGVIDIDMPVEGNVDEPDFKYGRVILKALGNLIVKAVASPFKFLGAALGIDAEKLEYMQFEYGSANLLPSEIEKLDQIAKMALKRPKIAFAFVPTYDKAKDTRALKTQVLIQTLLKQSKIKSDEDLQNSLSIELLEDVYLQAHKEDELEKLQQSLHKKYKKDEVFTVEYRKALLASSIAQQKLPPNSLKKLAKERFANIKEYLINQKMIDPKRIIEKDLAMDSGENKEFVDMKVEITIPK